MASMNVNNTIISALSDPTRIEILHRLMEGPTVVAELVDATGSSQPNISNHLAVLRRAKLVVAEQEGKQRRYVLANPAVASLIESLLVLSDPPATKASPPVAFARTCYDHLAGQLGVAIFQGLSQSRMVRQSSDGALTLTKKGEQRLSDGGIDITSLYHKRRRFAYECLDWTEKKAHIGGSLGAAICAHCVQEGWIVRNSANRSVRLTAQGRSDIAELFGANIPEDGLRT